MTDPIADFITRLKNAYLARQSATTMPHSKLKEHLASLLKAAGYIQAVENGTSETGKKILKLKLVEPS